MAGSRSARQSTRSCSTGHVESLGWKELKPHQVSELSVSALTHTVKYRVSREA